ncbi:DNA-DIRECTED RNA polymerase D SUBUNIT 2B-RELATED [Salix viminalis]|uniref:DNA-directed RNA polymerase n=1 Tax=Salix viminalis TaxID=40686 RepID=A0A9Q0ZJP3_SALVM|nr:DNA-DIRECTED RNA polymerase D SUBUNIT 2B-RELATED [Salix viminalis]
MGASSDYMEEVGPSSKGEVDDMDMDEDLMDTTNLNELGKETLQSFLDSVRVFDSFGEGSFVEPRIMIHPSVRMVNGDVHRLGLERSTLNRPSFWGDTSSDAESIICFPCMPSLNMTYSNKNENLCQCSIYTQTAGRRDKFKTGIDKVVQKECCTYRKQGNHYRKDAHRRKERPLCVLLVDRDPDMDIIFAFGVRLNSRRHKVRFLGYMVKCLLEAYTGHRKCDNRDSFRNKRFKLASELLERELKVHVSHASNDQWFDESTGAWCHPFKWMERVYGVMGNLGRANPLQTMIDLRKTRQQVLYTGKVGDARYPHPSHWGRVCFLSTPDESLVDELFDSGMEKQVDDTYTKLDGKHKAIGFSTTNPNIRVDTLFHQLHYPQRPLFRTMISDCLGKPGYPFGHNAKSLPKPELFNGQNAIVAVNVHLGYNQEDSLVMKRASLERGMFRSEHIRSYKAEVDNKELTDKRRKSEDSITFGKIQSKIGRVDSLDDDGFPFIGANMQSGDIVIGKCAESETDHSVKLKHSERGIVQKVVLSSNDGGKNSVVGSWRQVLKHAWAKECFGLFGVSGEHPFHNSRCCS